MNQPSAPLGILNVDRPYDACYPSDEWTPTGFDDAERFRTVHYRQAVDAALQARAVLASRGEQLRLPTLA